MASMAAAAAVSLPGALQPPRRLPQQARRSHRPALQLGSSSKPQQRCRQQRRRLAPPTAAAAAAGGGQPGGEEVIEADFIIDGNDGSVRVQPQAPADRRELWKRAIKLPMYSVGWMPILVSAASAYLQTGAFDPARTALLLVAATAIIGWLNLSNDVFDGLTGVDASNKPESVVALLGGGKGAARAVFAAATALLLSGGAILFWLLQSSGNPLAAKMLYAAIAMGYVYQGPPFRWSYLGLGEPLCFAAFGPLATCAFYFAQVPPAMAVFNKQILGLSGLVGITTTVILFCAHFHQIEGDRLHGKMSPLVRLGTKKGTEVLKFAVGLTYISTLVMCVSGVLPFAVFTSAIVAYGLAGEMVRLAENNLLNPEGLKPLKFLATRWHIAFCSMLVLGLLLSTLM